MTSDSPQWSRAFVTGGGSGIGLALAQRLAANGSAVALFDLGFAEAARQAVLSARASADQSVVFHEVDVRDAPGVRTAVDAAVAEIGPPDLVVNSAGINVALPFHELDDDAFERIVDVNLKGSRNVAYATLRHMARGTQLVLVSSLAGLTANWCYAGYSASKFGVVGLAGVLRMECRPLGVGVSVVCPPNVPTPMSAVEEGAMHPVQRELKAIAGEVSLDHVVGVILKGARKRKFLVIPGIRAKLTYYLLKLAPLWLQHAVANRTIDKVLEKHPGAVPDWGDD